MTQPAPLDIGNELTVLAWRRTLLRWVLVAVVAARIFTDEFGAVAVVVTLATIVVASALNLAASRAYSEIRTGSGLPTPLFPAALSRPTVRLGATVGCAVALGLVALWWVLFG